MNGFKRRQVGGKELGRAVTGVWKWNKQVLRPPSDGRETERKERGLYKM